MATETTTITGSSDDLLDFAGHLYEEFGANDEGVIEFSDGTVIRVHYDNNGTWRFEPKNEGPAFVGIEKCNEEDEEYSDVLTVSRVDWAKYTPSNGHTQRVYAKGVFNPVREMADIIDHYDCHEAAELIQQLFEKRLANVSQS